ncbi:MAG: 50S ribosomal protein L4 [Anaerolineae bacterium]|nr:50S ribosomal protein L4 [Anaerolineae bacterium]
MQVPVMNKSGKQVETIDLPADIFEVEINKGLMHQAYVRQMANARLGTHNTLDRGEVNLTKAKWYRQKGTGRARHGAQSAPIFVGGGVAHGPHPRKYTKAMPKKMRRQAIRSALSALLRDEQLVFVDSLSVDTPKTKEMRSILELLAGTESKTLVLLADRNDNVQRSVNNLPNARTLRASYLNIRDLHQYDKVVVPLDALEVIKSIWGRE